jgi:signal transduction histidine kinase/ActR/RegA family two-component response regulator
MRSIKAAILFFILAVAALCTLALSGFVLDRMIVRQSNRYHEVLDSEKDFATLVVKEQMALRHTGQYQQVVALYDRLKADLQDSGLHIDPQYLAKRESIYRELVETSREIGHHHDKVRKLLPDLVASVRYIHQHHITYLKNLLHRGHSTQDYDVGPDFKRSAVRSAPELDTIRMAVAIQNHLLNLFNLFSNLRAGGNPSAVKEAFHKHMRHFYDAVNNFEDYSLDAQDGLLVEELLLTGRQFEADFNYLLTAEAKLLSLSGRLEKNAEYHLSKFKKARLEIAAELERRNDYLRLALYSGVIGFVALVAVLLYLGRRLNRALRRTVTETRHIQADIDYRIPIETDQYAEFRVIYQAMNTMADTIQKQVNDLESAGSELSRQVKARTAGLQQANELLKREIQERETAEAQRIELEAQLNRAKNMEAIGTLAGGVAHDLNNILSGIVSYPDLLLRTMEADHAMRGAVMTIKSSGEKAAAIVQDLLTLARRGVSVQEVVDLKQIAKSYMASPEFQQLQASFPHVQITTDFTPDTTTISGSRIHLEKNLMNLVTNAMEAIDGQGSVGLSIENVYVDTALKGYDTVNEGEYVLLRVKDTGSGITDTDLERLFEPFFTKKEMGRSGTGLGMAVVWGTVKDHNGYINVSSAPGMGTTFELYFPLSRGAAAATQSVVELDNLRGQGQTILVVDDIAEQRFIAVQILNQLGYKAEAVDGGHAAIRYVETHAIDLLVLDMIMPPGPDGLDTFRQISAIRPGIKAIIASGFSETDRVREAQELGAGTYIRKPYTIEKIAAAVRDTLASE